ncbi:MAG: class I SAM-dependent methyltransferase [archaeon]|nr:class I SAM-dependent methyltransferase [archaeon]
MCVDMVEKDQYQCPRGAEGKEVIKKMNEHHRDLTIWGLYNIPKSSAKNVLDIGCGGGNCLKLLSVKYPNAKCVGVDISEDCVESTLELNKVFHSWGKVDAMVASVEDLPFPEKTFDIVTAVETYFFWPDLKANIAHIASRLNDKGVLCIVSEQYFTESNRTELAKTCEEFHMNLVDNDVLRSHMEAAGLSTEVIVDEEKNWVTFLGTKN